MASKQVPKSRKIYDHDEVRILTASDACFVVANRESMMLGTLIPKCEPGFSPVWTTVEHGGNSLCSAAGFLFAQDVSREGRFAIDVACLEKSRVLFSVAAAKNMLAMCLLPTHVIFYGTADGIITSAGPSGILVQHPLPHHQQPAAIEPCPHEPAATLVLTQTHVYCVDTLKGIVTNLQLPVRHASLAQW